MPAKDPRTLSPAGFEQFVRELLDQESFKLQDYRSEHLETIAAHDGDYEFDVTARFTASGEATFLVVVECKRWKAPVEREQVQALEMKRQSVGAHKAMLFTTGEIRKGAVEFATAHRIALVQVQSGATKFRANAYGDRHPYDSWLPAFAGWLHSIGDEGTVTWRSLGSFKSPFGMHESHGYLGEFLGRKKEGV